MEKKNPDFDILCFFMFTNCYLEENLLVLDARNCRVQAFDREGNFKYKFGSEGGGVDRLSNPQGITIDNDGNIVIADCGKSNPSPLSTIPSCG